MNTATSKSLFARAGRVLPGGVNSPVRAFRSVGLDPRFIVSGNGSRLTDADGNVFIDYVSSWGPMLFGHNHPAVREAVERTVRDGLGFGAPSPLEVDMAELATRLTGIDVIRMVNSGTEAVMGAIRVARGFTKRNKVVKFAGCYHGHSDMMLVKAGSGLLTGGVPDSAGVPPGVTADTLTARYNDADSVEALFKENPDAIAAVIVEPVAANMGVVPPKDGFLQALRDISQRHGALLIFDEVITGFRLAPGGAQEYFGIRADLVTYGKIIGGGMPVGAYGGRRDIMEMVAPLGPVYQAGTLSGNPVAMTAGLAQLSMIDRDRDVYARIDRAAARLADGLAAAARSAGAAVTVSRVGSLLTAFFLPAPAVDYESAVNSDTTAYAAYFAGMLDRGIYLAPSQFEAMFVSAAHSDEDIDATVNAAKEALAGISHA
ncbi:MAG: glutamate-1-semialdehyde 2,1-aminomutase [Planctomycetes bacterium]|nr:glutamate-1-semialdehyde 2,1-aminomutase [Planctomycetota bacterium]